MAEGELPSTRLSAESGMSLLMDMANGFVNDVVQYKTIDKFMEDNNVHKFSDFGDVDWDEYLLYALGFAICAGIGILLLVILPLSGCIIGCSQCCKCCCTCCGGRKKYQKENHSRGEEYGCSASLLVIACIMLASVVCSFLVTEMYRRELDPKDGVLEDVLKGVKAMDKYIDDSLLELNTSVVDGIGETKLDVFILIDTMPNATKDSIGMQTGVKTPLDQLHYFTSHLQELSDALGGMETSTVQLQDKLAELEIKLSNSKTDILPLLKGCPPSYVDECKQMEADLTHLRITTEFTEVDNVTEGRAAVDIAKNTDVSILIGAGVEAFNSIAETIDNNVGDELDGLKDQIEEIEDTIVQEVLGVSDEIRTIDLTPAMDEIITAKPDLEEYGYYVYAAITGMNTIMLLVVVLLIIGVIVGLCCPTPSKSSSSCDGTSIHGANVLTAAASFTLIFSWILIIMLVALFLGGGLVQSMGCRHIKTYDSSMEYIEQLLWAEIKDGNSDFTYNISFRQAMLECQQDHSLYAAADIEKNGFNISELLDLSRYDIYELIDELKGTDINIGQLELLDDDVKATIFAVDAGLNTSGFDKYQSELEKDTTIIDVTKYGSDLNALANRLNSVELRDESLKLLNLGNSEIPEIEGLKSSLGQELSTALTIYPKQMTQNVNELAEGEQELNANASQLIKVQIDVYGDLILSEITNFTVNIEVDIRVDIGKCRVLFDAGVGAVYGSCVYFLDPVNAIWFCYGWFLFFSIPAVILAIQLGNIFKTMAASDPEGPYEADDYAGAEHYPLYYAPKGKTGHHGIHDNVVHPAYGEVFDDARESRASLKSNQIHPLKTDSTAHM